MKTSTLEETYVAFYRRDYRDLVGLAYVLTGSRWVAEDLAQDAMTEAHRRWSKIHDYDDPGAWVRRVMINKKISAARKVDSEGKMLRRLRSRRTEDTVTIPERSNAIWSAVSRLPRRQAEVIALFYWEDRPIAEIADILGLGIETVKTHLKRGRAALSQVLQPEAEVRL